MGYIKLIDNIFLKKYSMDSQNINSGMKADFHVLKRYYGLVNSKTMKLNNLYSYLFNVRFSFYKKR